MDIATYTRIGPAIGYLAETYDPVSILIFGSYIDGTYTEASDLDCLIILDPKNTAPDLIDAVKDESIIDGLQLDCDICTVKEALEGDVTNFVKTHDAMILFDDGTGYKLVNRVKEYLEKVRITPQEEKIFIILWAKKTLSKFYKNTDESNFRAIHLMCNSLPYYFTLRDKIFYGPKKAIDELKDSDPKGYELFHNAASSKSLDDIRKWVLYVININ